MIRLTLTIQNKEAFEFAPALKRFIRKAPITIRERLRSRMSESKSGRMYRRKGGQGFKRFHRASAPGEAPATDTGAYSRSLQIIYPRTLEGAIVTNLKYPDYLEAGTSKMRPRPMWLPVVDELLPQLEIDLAREFMRL